MLPALILIIPSPTHRTTLFVRAHLSLGSVYAPAVEFGIREVNRERDARACIAVSEPAPGSVLEAHRHRWLLILLVLKRKARAKAIERRTSLAQLHAAKEASPSSGTHRIGPFTPELRPYTTMSSVGTFPTRKSVPVCPMAHFIDCATDFTPHFLPIPRASCLGSVASG